MFPNKIKPADISKQGKSLLPKNFRRDSILPCVLRIFDRIIRNQLLKYIVKFLTPFICRYRGQLALLCLAEEWKATLDSKNFAGGILINLSKALRTINHKL